MSDSRNMRKTKIGRTPVRWTISRVGKQRVISSGISQDTRTPPPVKKKPKKNKQHLWIENKLKGSSKYWLICQVPRSSQQDFSIFLFTGKICWGHLLRKEWKTTLHIFRQSAFFTGKIGEILSVATSICFLSICFLSIFLLFSFFFY